MATNNNNNNNNNNKKSKNIFAGWNQKTKNSSFNLINIVVVVVVFEL